MTFEERIAGRYAEMSPAEQRVVRFFRSHREEVLITSAAALAAKAKTSDATIVRTARALGYPGLDALRRDVAREMRHSLSPAERLSRTLEEVGDSPAAAFRATIETHLACLQSLAGNVIPAQFEGTIKAIAGARRVVVFGIGPSSAIANYFAIQLSRFGIDAITLTNTGLLFADDVRKLRAGDLVILLAYGRVYAELGVLLDAAAALRLRDGSHHRHARRRLEAAGRHDPVGAARAVRHAEHAHGNARFHRGTAGRHRDTAPGADARQPQETEPRAHQAGGQDHAIASDHLRRRKAS